MSTDKCTVLHIGCDVKTSTNDCHSCTLGGFQLSDTPETTGLGIIIDSKIRFDKYIRPTSVARKAHIRKKT